MAYDLFREVARGVVRAGGGSRGGFDQEDAAGFDDHLAELLREAYDTAAEPGP